MKYIINKSPINTTNNFNINDLKIDLDLPNNLEFHDFKINKLDEFIYDTRIMNSFNSKIGLKFNKTYNLNIAIPNNIKDTIEFTYEFNNNDTLIDSINIIFEENSSANIIFKYISNDNGNHFHHLNLKVLMNKYASGNISIINLLNNNSKNFVALENETKLNSTLTTNLIDIGGNTKVNNIYANTKDKSTNKLNNIYIGTKNDIIDMTYFYKNNGIMSNNNIEVQGVLDDKAKKVFRGIIDFQANNSESIGKENENCILLSGDCLSRSVPMLLCGEENVEGAHSVSSGKIEENKLFYIMSRGFNKVEAQKLIINSNFNSILNEIPNEELVKQLLDTIDEKISI